MVPGGPVTLRPRIQDLGGAAGAGSYDSRARDARLRSIRFGAPESLAGFRRVLEAHPAVTLHRARAAFALSCDLINGRTNRYRSPTRGKEFRVG
jgi:hypothetical protein